jgi:hypothetical protein
MTAGNSKARTPQHAAQSAPLPPRAAGNDASAGGVGPKKMERGRTRGARSLRRCRRRRHVRGARAMPQAVRPARRALLRGACALALCATAASASHARSAAAAAGGRVLPSARSASQAPALPLDPPITYADAHAFTLARVAAAWANATQLGCASARILRGASESDLGAEARGDGFMRLRVDATDAAAAIYGVRAPRGSGRGRGSARMRSGSCVSRSIARYAGWRAAAAPSPRGPSAAGSGARERVRAGAPARDAGRARAPGPFLALTPATPPVLLSRPTHASAAPARSCPTTRRSAWTTAQTPACWQARARAHSPAASPALAFNVHSATHGPRSHHTPPPASALRPQAPTCGCWTC